MLRNKKMFSDMALNITASAIPIFVLQLLILPALSRGMSNADYGLLVTILALLNIVPATMGSALNNIRLLYQNDYDEKKYEGDFNVLLLILAAINLVMVGLFSYAYDHRITFFNLFMTLAVSVVWLSKEYFIVAFRLKIDYIAIMINNLLQVAGYGIGFLLCRVSGCWQLIYLTGYVASLLYIFARCRLWREKLQITPLFRRTTRQGTLLLLSTLLNRVLTYADKLLIYPILGGALVSVYYAASIFGKAVSLMVTPINSVILTYLSKAKKRQDHMFRTSFLLGAAVCIAAYFLLVLISRPVLGILYPQYLESARHYILLTTATAMFSALISIVNPYILKFFDMKWQMIINGGTVMVYLVLCMGLLRFWGLFGFCVGALLTNVIKLAFMLCIFARC